MVGNKWQISDELWEKMGRDADLLIVYALHFGCNTWQKLMSSALSAMKLMAFDVTDIQHPVSNVTSACKLCSKTFQLNFSYSGAKP